MNIKYLGHDTTSYLVRLIKSLFIKKEDVVDNCESTNKDAPLSANQGLVLKKQIEILNTPHTPNTGYCAVSDNSASGGGIVLTIEETSSIWNMSNDTNEHVLYVPIDNNLVLAGQKVYLGDNEVTCMYNGNWDGLDNITDGRGWNAWQVIPLVIKGSGTEGQFEYVRLLSIPYSLAENVNF